MNKTTYSKYKLRPLKNPFPFLFTSSQYVCFEDTDKDECDDDEDEDLQVDSFAEVRFSMFKFMHFTFLLSEYHLATCNCIKNNYN